MLGKKYIPSYYGTIQELTVKEERSKPVCGKMASIAESLVLTSIEAEKLKELGKFCRPQNVPNVLARLNLEAAVCRCSSKLVFLKISQISQKNTCVGASF